MTRLGLQRIGLEDARVLQCSTWGTLRFQNLNEAGFCRRDCLHHTWKETRDERELPYETCQVEAQPLNVVLSRPVCPI